MEYRPLEGFVLAITPFNFTAIAGNLPTAPALMGNVVVWKPSPTQQLAAHYTMRLLEAAGLPPGVINLVTGDGQAVSEVALPHPDLAGIHFTGSTATFQHLWRTVGEHIAGYRSYPRLVGETGGKDFVVAHPSADPAVLATALIRGAFEYQGQKCSAASRAYVPRSVWERHARRPRRPGRVADHGRRLRGPVANFMGAVIDGRALRQARRGARTGPQPPRGPGPRRRHAPTTARAGSSAPTVLECSDPADEVVQHRVLRPDPGRARLPGRRDYDDMLAQAADVAPYALTGAILAQDRAAIAHATEALRYAAGNFYVNDKPTGAVVGQQPFGGARATGTNDKAGSILNLMRWVSPRAIKETFAPPTDYRYPHMG